jgi:hypothetical protein
MNCYQVDYINPVYGKEETLPRFQSLSVEKDKKLPPGAECSVGIQSVLSPVDLIKLVSLSRVSVVFRALRARHKRNGSTVLIC